MSKTTPAPTNGDPRAEGRTLTLAGERYTFDLSLGALRRAHDDHGVELSYADLGGVSFRTQLRLMWVGLLSSHPEITEDDAVALYDRAGDEEREEWQARMLTQVHRYVRTLNRAAEAVSPTGAEGKGTAGKKQGAAPRPA